MKVSPHLIWQLQGEPLGAIVEQVQSCAADPIQVQQLTHIVNLYLIDGELPADQAETVAAIHRAQSTSTVATRLVVVADARDHVGLTSTLADLVPDSTIVTAEFSESMPQAFEILAAGVAATDEGDHIVFTNADICPVPSFYDATAHLIAAGAESLVVNRRSVFGFWPGEPLASLAAFSLGAAHPGFDCFVFHASALPAMVTTDATVGSPYVMLSVLFNLVAVSAPLAVLTDAHLTYHFGDDRAWSAAGRNESLQRNLAAARTVRDGHDTAGAARIGSFLGAFPNWDPDAIAQDLG